MRSHAMLCLTLVACAAPGRAPEDGAVQAVVTALDAAAVTRIALVALPANVSIDLSYQAASGTFTGTLSLVSGTETLTATAYAGTTVVGTGSAAVTVTAGQVTQVTITILDASGAPGQPGHSPVITSFVIPGSAQVGDHAAVSATASAATTPTFAWSVAPAICGVFADAAAASTTFTPAAAGACTLEVAATAEGLTSTQSGLVTISTATGSIGVSGSFVPQPVITDFSVNDHVISESVSRTASDATLRGVLAKATHCTVTLALRDAGAGAVSSLTDSCGGAISAVAGAAGTAAFDWTSPSSKAVCLLTGKVVSQGLQDQFSVLLVVGP